MALAGLITITNEMADQIRSTLEAVTTVQVQVEPTRVWNPTPPTVDIMLAGRWRDPDTASFDDIDVFGGYLLTVRARVPTADHDAGRSLLYAFADDTNDLCLAQALLDDPTLNGYAASLHPQDFSGEVVYSEGDQDLLGFQFTVLVIPGNS